MADQEFREFVDERWQDGVPPTPNEVAEAIKLAVEVTLDRFQRQAGRKEASDNLYLHLPTKAEIESEMLRRLEAKNGD